MNRHQADIERLGQHYGWRVVRRGRLNDLLGTAADTRRVPASWRFRDEEFYLAELTRNLHVYRLWGSEWQDRTTGQAKPTGTYGLEGGGMWVSPERPTSASALRLSIPAQFDQVTAVNLRLGATFWIGKAAPLYAIGYGPPGGALQIWLPDKTINMYMTLDVDTSAAPRQRRP